MSTSTLEAVKAATPIVGDARFKAVRRVKNRLQTQLDADIRKYTRAIAASKDPAKVAANKARVDVLTRYKAVVSEI